jgi:hypothetical protein
VQKLGTETAWDGKTTSFVATLPPLNPWTQAAWVPARARVVGDAIGEAAAKFNSKRISAAIVKTHLVNAMLTRAIEISGRLVQEEIWDSLTNAGRALVTRTLKERKGGRRTTRQRRNGTRRAMQGGGAEDEIWVDIVSCRVKESRLMSLAAALEKQFKDNPPKNDVEYNQALMSVFMQHIVATDAEINQYLADTPIEALWGTIRPKGREELPRTGSDEEESGGPMRRITSSRRMDLAGPIAVDTSPSGTASPMSKGTASPSKTPVGTPPAPGTPVTMLSPTTVKRPGIAQPDFRLLSTTSAPRAPSDASQSTRTESNPATFATLGSLASFPGLDEEPAEVDGDATFGRGRVFTLGTRPKWL